MWQVTADGLLRSGRQCLTQTGSRAVLAKCRSSDGQHWRHTLLGNLINRASHLCLTASPAGLAVEACGHNLAPQIWTLPDEGNEASATDAADAADDRTAGRRAP
jgi:hypothetical protein